MPIRIISAHSQTEFHSEKFQTSLADSGLDDKSSKARNTVHDGRQDTRLLCCGCGKRGLSRTGMALLCQKPLSTSNDVNSVSTDNLVAPMPDAFRWLN